MYFKIGLKLGPNRSEFLTNLGGVLQAQGRIDEAIDKFDEALAISEDFDLNYRLRKEGGEVVASNSIKASYIVRKSVFFKGFLTKFSSFPCPTMVGNGSEN